MADRAEGNIIGILGGMGPLASAEFLKTIYEASLGEREQDSPVVLLYSDPTFPDRTEEFLRGSVDPLLHRLTDALNRLLEMGASSIVICCVTIHHLLPRLPAHLREKVVSLVDVILNDVARTRQRHLLICTNGTRKLGLFEGHSRWPITKDYVLLPDEKDQEMIHDKLIYRTKKNNCGDEMAPLLRYLLSKYEVDSLIAGCTEFHVITKRLRSLGDAPDYSCVDPLMIIAKELARKPYEASRRA